MSWCIFGNRPCELCGMAADGVCQIYSGLQAWSNILDHASPFSEYFESFTQGDKP